MRAYSLTHLGDRELLHGLASLVAQDRTTTAEMIAHIAEVDARRLYLPAAHPSMFSYCVHELRFSEDAAYKRIQAARVARQYPAILESLADGQLHLGAVCMLAPHLTAENSADLIAAAAGRTKPEIEELLARRSSRSESLGLVQAFPASPPPEDGQLAPGQVGAPVSQLATGSVGMLATVAPVAPSRFFHGITFDQRAEAKLRYAQDLLGHSLPSGDVAQVIERGLDSLIRELEKRKFAAATRPRGGKRSSTNPRHIPADVKRTVWQRDGGQCTFVSKAGRRCPARKFLEFDHIEEVARGGRASVAGIRLRCRAHNQLTAECAFGAGFMHEKREAARSRAKARRRESEARAAEEARRREAESRARAAARELITPLRLLGFRADEARQAAAVCEDIPDAPLEQRVRRALSHFHSRRHATRPAGALRRS